MGGYVIVSEIGSQITFIRDNLPIKKSDLLLKKPIPIFYMIVIWLEKAWLVDKSGGTFISQLNMNYWPIQNLSRIPQKSFVVDPKISLKIQMSLFHEICFVRIIDAMMVTSECL